MRSFFLSSLFSAGLLTSLLTPCGLENVAHQELTHSKQVLSFKSICSRISECISYFITFSSHVQSITHIGQKHFLWQVLNPELLSQMCQNEARDSNVIILLSDKWRRSKELTATWSPGLKMAQSNLDSPGSSPQLVHYLLLAWTHTTLLLCDYQVINKGKPLLARG